MSLKINPVIVFPIHKEILQDHEKFAVNRLANILKDYDKAIVSPFKNDVSFLVEILPNAFEYKIENHWMDSITSYNKLIKSPLLFRRFYKMGYSHLLLHEPDAVVLKDELLYWCEKPFDYIGAPWFEGKAKPVKDAEIIGVGNSGFSLFNMEKVNYIFDSKIKTYFFRQFLYDIKISLKNKKFNKLKYLFQRYFFDFTLDKQWKYDPDMLCDSFWSNYVTYWCNNFKIANKEMAVQFSWEVMPEKCYVYNKKELPFGIHAWFKYNPMFIMEILPEFVSIYNSIKNESERN